MPTKTQNTRHKIGKCSFFWMWRAVGGKKLIQLLYNHQWHCGLVDVSFLTGFTLYWLLVVGRLVVALTVLYLSFALHSRRAFCQHISLLNLDSCIFLGQIWYPILLYYQTNDMSYWCQGFKAILYFIICLNAINLQNIKCIWSPNLFCLTKNGFKRDVMHRLPTTVFKFRQAALFYGLLQICPWGTAQTKSPSLCQLHVNNESLCTEKHEPCRLSEVAHSAAGSHFSSQMH